MSDKSKLEKTAQYAVSGAPELKPDEKRKWLGEFRERVILGLTKEQVFEDEAIKYVEKALKDKMADILIINQKIPMSIVSEYMRLTKKTGCEFKTVSTDSKTAMGLVVVSRQAVERENVEISINKYIEECIEKCNEKDKTNKKQSLSIWRKIGKIFKK